MESRALFPLLWRFAPIFAVMDGISVPGEPAHSCYRFDGMRALGPFWTPAELRTPAKLAFYPSTRADSGVQSVLI